MAKLAGALGLYLLSTTPVAFPGAMAVAAVDGVDPMQTASVVATAPLEQVNRAGKSDRLAIAAVPDAEPTVDQLAFAYAVTGASALSSNAIDDDSFMVAALAARPLAPAPSIAPTGARLAVIAPNGGPIAYVDPGATDGFVDPFQLLINPESKPVAAIALPDFSGDHDWADNPIPASALSTAEVRCMAEAIYFEARSEPVRGQLAVAQVVVNRLKNPTYPSTVCGVVYQNQHMRNACQFSFACDGYREVIRDRSSWATALDLAQAMLAGDAIYLEEIGTATHYHATYVRPAWARQMQRMGQIGLHIFYRTYGGGWI